MGGLQTQLIPIQLLHENNTKCWKRTQHPSFCGKKYCTKNQKNNLFVPSGPGGWRLQKIGIFVSWYSTASFFHKKIVFCTLTAFLQENNTECWKAAKKQSFVSKSQKNAVLYKKTKTNLFVPSGPAGWRLQKNACCSFGTVQHCFGFCTKNGFLVPLQRFRTKTT